MKEIIKKVRNPNLVGELFRELTFVKINDYSVGCYDSFDLTQDFNQVFDKEKLDNVAKILDIDEVFSCYYNDKLDLLVAWHWDGDGFLYFKHDKIELINKDCKKTHVWSFV